MSIADTQARWMIPLVLRNTVDLYESPGAFTFERTDDPLWVMNPKSRFKDPETNQWFYGLAYVAISESEETIRLLRERLEAVWPK